MFNEIIETDYGDNDCFEKHFVLMNMKYKYIIKDDYMLVTICLVHLCL